MVTECFTADASHRRQMLLSLFGGHAARCLEQHGATLPSAKACNSIKGPFYPFVSLISMPFLLNIFSRESWCNAEAGTTAGVVDPKLLTLP